MPRRQAENTEKKNQKERRVMSQKERVDLIEVDLLDMCKYISVKVGVYFDRNGSIRWSWIWVCEGEECDRV